MAKEEEKQLLLQDLSARLPYGVIINVPIIGGSEGKKLISIINEDDGVPVVAVYTTKEINSDETPIHYTKETYLLVDVLPYLRPMSSMTEEEQEEFFDLIICVDKGKAVVEEDKIYAYNNFIYSHHLDNKNFIEKGLALEAPSDMYNNKT